MLWAPCATWDSVTPRRADDAPAKPHSVSSSRIRKGQTLRVTATRVFKNVLRVFWNARAKYCTRHQQQGPGTGAQWWRRFRCHRYLSHSGDMNRIQHPVCVACCARR